MLKPWVVYSLYWIYKGGLLFVLVAIVALGCRRTASPAATRMSQRNFKPVLLGLFAVAGLAGSIIGYTGFTAAAAVVCLMAHGLCRLTSLAWIPLSIVAWFGLPLGALFLDEQHNEYLPKQEVRLASGVICRAYPKQFDSITGTLLVAVRPNSPWFLDEFVEGPSGPQSNVAIGCTLVPDGQVVMMIKSETAEETVTRRVN